MKLTGALCALLAAAALTLTAAGTAEAVGPGNPEIISPTEGALVPAGFTGPFHVAFTNAPTGGYNFEVRCTSGEGSLFESSSIFHDGDTDVQDISSNSPLPPNSECRVTVTDQPWTPDGYHSDTRHFTVNGPPAPLPTACVIGAPSVSNAATPVGVVDSVTRTVTVKLTNCTATQAGATTVKWYSDGAEGGAFAMKTLSRTSLGNNTYSYKGSVVDRPIDIVNIMAGTYPTSVRTVRGTVKMQRTAPSLRLLRRSTMAQQVYLAKGYGSAFNKGDHLEIYANHKRANWDTMRYGWYYNGTVKLQFRTTTGSYQTLQTGKPDGPFFTNVTVDGCYRFVFSGNLTTGPATSRGTCIDVR